MRLLVRDHSLSLSSPQLIQGEVSSREGERMAITVQMQFESAVTEMYQDAFVGSSIENGVTIITFDLRQHDFQQELGTQARLWWRQAS